MYETRAYVYLDSGNSCSVPYGVVKLEEAPLKTFHKGLYLLVATLRIAQQFPETKEIDD